jgi:phosphate butyryltransferase
MNRGINIRRLREKSGLKPDELAALIDLTTEQIIKIEEHQEECSVSVLLKIASALDSDLHTLLYGKAFDEKSVMLTRKEERVRVERRKFFDYESLTPSYPGRHMEPFMVDVHPPVLNERGEEIREFSSHEGEEFHYVIEGKLRLTVKGEDYFLSRGDSVYFDSSLPHALSSVGKKTRIMAVIYNAVDMKHRTRSKKMRELIEAAKHLGGRDMVIVIPSDTALEAVCRAMDEGIVNKAWLVGDPGVFPEIPPSLTGRFIQADVLLEAGEEPGNEEWQLRCAKRGVELISQGQGDMLMKGNINTSLLFKQVLVKEMGLTRGRRLSLVSIFEIPGLNRLIFLTDPGINPALVSGNGTETARDIIHNGIEVARALGVVKPKVAILDANELPSVKNPTSMTAHELTQLDWGNAVVEGPLSYDLALYPDSVEHKGVTDSAVAGKADILVVPQISGGNFLYKAWGMTVGAEYANVVAGARVPLIITSRSDSDMTKFLTICASVVYKDYSGKKYELK